MVTVGDLRYPFLYRRRRRLSGHRGRVRPISTRHRVALDHGETFPRSAEFRTPLDRIIPLPVRGSNIALHVRCRCG
ncbi:hypothetical protein AArc1_2386 [Natrarchaeobaculum sulfurireducens]|uniref:Uncharacterized protein n=1 Tax=Natrarchaeobaculum sulfurireducens TaxID=2044521 RepID=A0A346PGQ6_9EURY|nr:hypothetical protein AArc1_2386 [Natrarchaeobaculum sulfurireducens]